MSIRRDIEEVLLMAIEREEEANRFYSAIAGRVKNRAVQETFSALGREELDHKKLLLGLLEDSAINVKFAPKVPDYKVAESESRPAVSEGLSLRDAIALAMKKEQQAVELYRGLSKAASAEAVRTLFENLMNMELGHKNKLEAIFVDVGYPEVF